MNKLCRMKIHIILNKYFRLPILGKKRLLKYLYKKRTGLNLNLDNPITFNEKIQLRKLEENNKKIIQCADKLVVREYVKEKIGERYLIPLYLKTSRLTYEDIKKLPRSFVLKTNNASGTNIIVFDKRKENILKIIKTMNNYVKIKYGYVALELFYNKIKPMILAEKLLLDEKGSIPDDYKFHCFRDGQNYKIYIQVLYDRMAEIGKNIYDENWQLQSFTMGDYQVNKKIIEKPENLDEMLTIVKKLASDFDYVRVDLYNINKKIYFGELTFTHASGYSKFSPNEYDRIWGTYWKNYKDSK